MPATSTTTTMRIAVLIPLLLSLTTFAAAAATPVFPIAARIPPSLDPLASTPLYPRFTLPPPNWSVGNWKVTWTSSKSYQVLLNMQFDSYPVLPTCDAVLPDDCAPGTYPGQLVDLTSFHLPNTTDGSRSSAADADPNTISTAFGFDTPRQLATPDAGAGFAGVYDFRGTGLFNTTANSYEIVAWGTNPGRAGAGWWVLHETAASGASPQEPALSIESRVEDGPSDEIMAAVRSVLRGLGSDVLGELVDGLERVVHDGRRTGSLPVVCGTKCQGNENIFMGIGKGRG